MEEAPKGGIGCLGVAIMIGIIIFAFAMAGDGDKNVLKKVDQDPATTQNTRSGTASGNQVELMSRNQLNLWSDVQNCYGDYSCMTIISTTTETVQNTTTETNNTVTGDRNNVYVSPVDGARFCKDEATGQYSPCPEGQ